MLLTIFLPTLFGKRAIFTRSPVHGYFVPSHFHCHVVNLRLSRCYLFVIMYLKPVKIAIFLFNISPNLWSVDCHSLILIVDSPNSDNDNYNDNLLTIQYLEFRIGLLSIQIDMSKGVYQSLGVPPKCRYTACFKRIKTFFHVSTYFFFSLAEKDVKMIKNIFFDQQMMCEAPVCW